MATATDRQALIDQTVSRYVNFVDDSDRRAVVRMACEAVANDIYDTLSCSASAASSDPEEERPNERLARVREILMSCQQTYDVPGSGIGWYLVSRQNMKAILREVGPPAEASEPCDNCPFRLQGINTPPETARALIERAMDPSRDHPCHKTITEDHPRPCRGAVQFRQNVTQAAGHEGIFSSVEAMLEAKTLGVEVEA